jgi:hypothetical protein
MTESEPLAEKARRLTVETYKYVAIASALRSQAEELEKETWKFLKELERCRTARRQAADTPVTEGDAE